MSVATTRHGAVVQITMSRPGSHNALDEALVNGLAGAIRAVDADPGTRAVVLTGGDRVFCAGADLDLVRGLLRTPSSGPGAFAPVFDALATSGTPVVAAVCGVALGGGTELVLACDTAIAGRGARFGLPEVTLGLIPGAGGTQRLRQAIGTVRARHLLLTGEVVDAAWALHAGLVTEMVDDDEVLARAHAVAARIARNSADAVRWARRAFAAGLAAELDTGLAAEARAFEHALAGPDAVEGLAAFAQRRPAGFGA